MRRLFIPCALGGALLLTQSDKAYGQCQWCAGHNTASPSCTYVPVPNAPSGLGCQPDAGIMSCRFTQVGCDDTFAAVASGAVPPRFVAKPSLLTPFELEIPPIGSVLRVKKCDAAASFWPGAFADMTAVRRTGSTPGFVPVRVMAGSKLPASPV
jgi:hypothetical protein